VLNVVNGNEQREKLSVDCELDYEEKTLACPTNAEDASRSIRYYLQAGAVEKIGDADFKPVLRPNRSLIAAEVSSQESLLFSPSGPLTRIELDLIDMQGDSLLMDRFLPDKPLAVDDFWKPSEKLMAQFLGLDEVGHSEVQSVLKEVTDKVARFEMAGRVSGAVDGVATAIEIKARYRFDLKRERIDWLGMVVKEKRQTSPVADGLDVVAQLQMTIVPADKTQHLSEEAINALPVKSTPELLQLSHSSKQGGWEITHDRSWHFYRDLEDAAVLRRIERGELIAQCNLSSLPQKKPDKLVTLENFQADVKQALIKEFKEFVEAGQTVDESNRRVLRVVVRGVAEDLPILWTYYHLADQQGRQMALVFVVEEKYAERFGKADQELIRSLRFIESST